CCDFFKGDAAGLVGQLDKPSRGLVIHVLVIPSVVVTHYIVLSDKAPANPEAVTWGSSRRRQIKSDSSAHPGFPHVSPLTVKTPGQHQNAAQPAPCPASSAAVVVVCRFTAASSQPARRMRAIPARATA